MKRVNGDLAVSRALGDFVYKNSPALPPEKQQVSCEPDIFVYERKHAEDQFIVLACDGIWDVMSNEECAAFIMGVSQGAGTAAAANLALLISRASHTTTPRLHLLLQWVSEGAAKSPTNPEALSSLLIEKGLMLQSRDNMSSVIIALPAAPKADLAAVSAYETRKSQEKEKSATAERGPESTTD